MTSPLRTEQAIWAASKHQSGWKPHQVAAAMAGWDYVADMRTSLDLAEFDGSDEARDLARGYVATHPWPGASRSDSISRAIESCADLVYEGMRAACRFLNKDNDSGE